MAAKPSIPKGTRDFSPVEMAKRNLFLMCLAKRMFPNPAKPVLGTPFTRPYGLLLLMLAALVAYGARSLTCGLAGCLALAASALLHGFLQVSCC